MAGERQGISRLVVASVVALLLTCTLVFVIVLIFTPQASVEQQTAAIQARNPAFNMEQTTPNADAQALAATQEAQLQAYSWVDQQAGIARIPIRRAMQLIVSDQPTAEVTPP